MLTVLRASPQFVDLCILLGCDYLDPIPKVGPNTALKLIREFGTLDKVLEGLGMERKQVCRSTIQIYNVYDN